MSELQAGYVVDASYANTFFRELSPAWLNYVRALSGAGALPLDRPFRYLELGCGFGHSIVVNAAAFPAAEFHACELNPVHVAGGQRHARALGVDNLQFHATSFQELRLEELPPFDFIVMHGVYSWVDAAARAGIRRVLREKLAPGGLLYVSYNCLPGWTSELPLRRLMLEIAGAASGDSATRAQHAVQTLQQLSGRKLQYFEAQPEAARAVELYGKLPGNYLAHEFLNDAWEPFYSVDIADEMAGVGLSFLGSATLAENHPMLLMDEATAQSLASLPTPRQRQLAADFATNRRFRRDVFIRAGGVRAAALGAAIVGCVDDPAGIEPKVKVPRGNISFDPEFMQALRALLAAGSLTMAEAVQRLSAPGRNPADIARNLVFLVAGGVLMPFARVASMQPAPREPHPMLARALAYAVETRTSWAVPSEVLGNGVLVTPAEAVAVQDMLAGRPASQAEVAEKVMRQLMPGLRRLGLA